MKEKVETQTFRPAKREPTEERIRSLKVPEGFRVGVFARDLGHPRMLLVLPDGSLLVSRFEEGDVLRLQDTDGDGIADRRTTVVRLKEAHGLAHHEGAVYLAGTTVIQRAKLKDDGTLGDPQEVAKLPDGGQHPRRTIGIGPDGLLYASIGSTCNNCEEPNPEHATLLQMRPDGSHRTVFARGLRNTIGFDWHPRTGMLWGMDHGSDHRGDDVPGEELNRITAGGDYGWPWCYNRGEVDPHANEPRSGTKEERCARSVSPHLLYQAHAAPIAFVFYSGTTFPADHQGDAFTALRGSWNREPAVGYKVVRVRFRDGEPQAFEDFLTGFLIEGGKAHFGRPAGLAVDREGALLVSDDTGGVIYRVTHPARD